MPWEGRQGVFILTPVAEPHQRGGPRAQCSSVQRARAASRSRAGDGVPWGAPCSVRKCAMLAFSRPPWTRTLTRAFLEAEAWWGGGVDGAGVGRPRLQLPLSLGRCDRRAVHRVLQQRRGPGGAAAGLFLRGLGREQLLGAGGGGDRPALHRPARGPGKVRGHRTPRPETGLRHRMLSVTLRNVTSSADLLLQCEAAAGEGGDVTGGGRAPAPAGICASGDGTGQRAFLHFHKAHTQSSTEVRSESQSSVSGRVWGEGPWFPSVKRAH